MILTSISNGLKESLKMMIFSKRFWRVHVQATQSPQERQVQVSLQYHSSCQVWMKELSPITDQNTCTPTGMWLLHEITAFFYFRKIKLQDQNTRKKAGYTFRMLSIEMLSTRRSSGLPHLTLIMSAGFLLDTKGHSHAKNPEMK